MVGFKGDFMHLKSFLITFVFVYLLISLPEILGIGYVIDWVSKPTFFQKFKEYIIDGLRNNFLLKTVIACMLGIVVCLVSTKRRQSS